MTKRLLVDYNEMYISIYYISLVVCISKDKCFLWLSTAKKLLRKLTHDQIAKISSTFSFLFILVQYLQLRKLLIDKCTRRILASHKILTDVLFFLLYFISYDIFLGVLQRITRCDSSCA